MKHLSYVLALAVGCITQPLSAQTPIAPDTIVEVAEVADVVEAVVPDSLSQFVAEPDSFVWAPPAVPTIGMRPLKRTIALPAVYSTYHSPAQASPFADTRSGNPALQWIEDEIATAQFEQEMQQRYMFAHPLDVRYNLASMPEPPKRYTAVVDPSQHTITISEVKIEDNSTLAAPEVKRRHWIRKFEASLQFSQAYVSPNWYQGGNNNLNMLANIFYNVKLNQEYHPNLLFDTTVQYKLGMNSAPDDSLRNYSISDDLFQFNSTFGVKAARRWYYSLNVQFKTQFLNSYKSNTRDLRSAFLSPADLNVGVGMTYNYANKKKTFTFDASIAPLSYNMRICTSDRLNHGDYGIAPDRKTVSKFGSSVECKLMWRISYNITFNSRIFAFTDYNRIYGDWENTLQFEINRYLTTQIYVHARYDTQTPKSPDPSWHKLQLKEILSIGLAYRFSTL